MKSTHSDAIMGALLAAAVLGGTKKEEAKAPEIDGDKIRKQSEDLGNSYYHVYLGYKDAGFNHEQAFIVDKCIDIVKDKMARGFSILLPFDTQKSNFVKRLDEQAEGCVLCYGMRDFIESSNYECDLIMTNPPLQFTEKNT